MMLGKRRRAAPSAPPSKRSKLKSTIEEIKFDFEAREGYLTGFHKRKLQRIKRAEEEAAKKGREERIRERKVLREGRKADLERHVEAVNAAVRKAEALDDSVLGSEDESEREEWGANDKKKPATVNHEDEYVAEDRQTIVTVEAVDVTRDGLQKVVSEDEDGGEDAGRERIEAEDASLNGQPKQKNAWSKEKFPNRKPKTKKKKFRYESKAERKVTRAKQRSGNSSKAKARRDEQA